jgi:hypothetical protein
MQPRDMDDLAALVWRALEADDGAASAVAAEVTAFRQRFAGLHFLRP